MLLSEGLIEIGYKDYTTGPVCRGCVRVCVGGVSVCVCFPVAFGTKVLRK
jgi:hypothetical protein